jgi:hypothetical protein
MQKHVVNLQPAPEMYDKGHNHIIHGWETKKEPPGGTVR